MKLKKIKPFVPQIVLAALIVLYFAAAPKTEKIVETALLNPKYNPDKITLSYSKEGRITFTKTGSFWICNYDSEDEKNDMAIFPCDSTVMENFLKNARNIIKVYEISDNLRQKDRFSLSDDGSFCMEFFQDEKTVSKLHFGAADSRKRIAFYAENPNSRRNAQKIYSTDSPILNYLTTSPDFWCDPYIFPKSICGDISDGFVTADLYFKDAQTGKTHREVRKDLNATEIAKLRHGKVHLSVGLSQLIAGRFYVGSSIEIDDGKGNFYGVDFSDKTDEEENYYCVFSVYPSDARDEVEKEFLEEFSFAGYTTKVSTWTYNRLITSAAK